jgi:hypothetical protein
MHHHGKQDSRNFGSTPKQATQRKTFDMFADTGEVAEANNGRYVRRIGDAISSYKNKCRISGGERVSLPEGVTGVTGVTFTVYERLLG